MSLPDLIHKVASQNKITITDDVIPMMIYMFSQIREPTRSLADKLNNYKTNEEKVKYLLEDIIKRAWEISTIDAGFSFIDAYSVWYVVKEDPELSQMLRTDYIPLPPGRIIVDMLSSDPDKIEYPAYSGLLHGYANRILPNSDLLSTPGWGKILTDYVKLLLFLQSHLMKSDIVDLNLNNVYNELVRVTNQ